MFHKLRIKDSDGLFIGRSLFFSDDFTYLPYYNRGHYYYQNSSTARQNKGLDPLQK